MSQHLSQMTDEEFLYAFAGRFLDDDMPMDLRKRYQLASDNAQYQGLAEKLGTARGRLQLAMQKIELDKDQLSTLHGLVEAPDSRQTHEMAKIEQVERGVWLATLKRRIMIVGTVCAVVFAVVYLTTPQRSAEFQPLEVLSYEALAFAEDRGDRIALPTDNIDEIREYLGRDPGLGFKAGVISSMPESWRPIGATIIDYEVTKVTAVMYENATQGGVLMHFALAGKLSDLPGAASGNYQGLIYQVYVQEELQNFIAWQQAENVIGILVSHLTDEDMAKIARSGIAY